MYIRSSYKLKCLNGVFYDKLKFYVVWHHGESELALHAYLQRFHLLVGNSDNMCCLTKAVCYAPDEVNYTYGPAALDELASGVYEGLNLDDLSHDRVLLEIAVHFVPRDSPAVGQIVLKHYDARLKDRTAKLEPLLRIAGRLEALGFEEV